jgi:hypothetical protein
MNLNKDLGQTGTQMTLFSQGDFLASHTQPLGSDLEKKMNATCGPKCLESYGRFNRNGLWAKTFSALLIGQEGWFSKRCKLTWKVKGTKYNRMYFQLRVSTLPTNEIGFGLLHSELLPTPESFDLNSARHPELSEKDKKKYAEKGINLHCNLRQMARLSLLPTPRAQERDNSKQRIIKGKIDTLPTMAKLGMLPTPTTQDARIGENNIGGSKHRMERGSVALADIALGLTNQMLPTPTRSDYNGRGNQPNWKGTDLVSTIHKATFQTGTTSQLNPQFVAEMMGFPPNWLELPFQNTETNP